MFAKLYNDIPSAEWEAKTAKHAGARAAVKDGVPTPHAHLRTTAKQGMEFLRAHARLPDGSFCFALTREGRPLAAQRKMFSACFYIMALSECGRACGEAGMREEALAVLEDVLRWAKDPTLLGRPVLDGAPPRSTLAVPMILLNLFTELQRGLPPADREAFHAADRTWCIAEIKKHILTDRKIVLENTNPDGTYDASTPDGRLLNPGHAIECGWFLLETATAASDDDLARLAIDVIEWSWEAGLDATHGGLFYFLDAEGYSPTQLEWSMKLWWPHCEAMIAFAMAYKVTGEAKYLDRFLAVTEYTLSHFSDTEHGEWFGYLDRRGDKTHRFKGGPYKGCFHVPRALLMVETLLGK